MTARSHFGRAHTTAADTADNTVYEEPLELSAPPEDEANRLIRDWGMRRALEQADARVDYWRNVVARLSAQPPAQPPAQPATQPTEIRWADLVGSKPRAPQGNRP